MQTNKNAQDLLDKYIEGTATAREQSIVESWYLDQSRKDANVDIPNHFSDEDMAEIRKVLIKYTIKSEYLERPVIYKLRKQIVSFVAASILLVGGGIGYFSVTNSKIQPNEIIDMHPGKNGAMLTLASGKQIKIEDSSKGTLAEEAGVTITKSASGEVTYQVTDQNSIATNKKNTLTTSYGETFKIRLPDGSNVWLNAASSLIFPVSFNNAVSRRVELIGEGYFEIEKDREKPFIVTSKNQTLEVLGTHFNIKSYNDESSEKITLIEGSVKLVPKFSSDKEYILAPSQQAVIKDGGVNVVTVNTDEVAAWTKGMFMFNDEELEGILTKISRWYNAEIIYRDESLKRMRFWGIVSKHDKLSKVLNMLEKTNVVKFEIQGKQIIVNR